ncbi:hypothetical protein GIB67_038584 [Kingdonia uniflora]|uniref:Uncharacterized protein n=1 Tax=Kingdonia uniflora TaxID=39325 RepID=A0A7J7NPE6_9MAGN|nr:hypothetical protein GIB67_038584 [Kingdonia uniflora]
MGRQDHFSRQGRSRKRCVLEVDDDEDVVNLVTATPVKRLVIENSKPVLPIQEGTSSTALSTMTMSPIQLANMGKLQDEVMVPTISAMLVLFQSQPVVPLDIVGFDDHHGLSVVRQKLQQSKACEYAFQDGATLNVVMENKGCKKSSKSSLFYEAPLGYGIEDVRPYGGIKKFRSAAYSNCVRKPS